ncbi:mannosyltransferase [Hysterangium stoloniferum]|nr:mannosyltransferase [Hysterangium stoloniferum]
MSLSGHALTWTKNLLFNHRFFWVTATAVILGDAILTQLIIHFVPYTEIDFETYMYQAELYISGVRDYSKISGPSGPLVYPAGHVYIHRLLSLISSGGNSLRLLQNIYGGLYLVSLFLTCSLYRTAGNLPNYVLLLLPLSKRLHSIFMLRLFNDCWSLVVVQGAIMAYATGWDDIASVLFSAALSIKMSIFLYLPGLLVVLFKRHGLFHTLRHCAVIAVSQGLIALPFISTYPRSYFASAFEFSRIFLYKWTVNWRFIPEDIFLSRPWAFTLLAMHLCTLVAFATMKWCKADGGVLNVLSRGLRHPTVGATTSVSADQVITILAISNLIGIIFARSLHYQFYSWYTQQLPFLLWRTKYPVPMRILALLCFEYAWNVFPSTKSSSGILLASHAVLLLGLWYGFPEGKEGTISKTTLVKGPKMD